MNHFLSLAVDHGQLPAQLDADMAAMLLNESLMGVLEAWLVQPETYDLSAVGERTVQAIFGMLHLSPLSKPTGRLVLLVFCLPERRISLSSSVVKAYETAIA